MSNNKYKILIIDDEDDVRNKTQALLEKNGYKVISAKSCVNGQMMFSSHRPDLVILELNLSDFDGLEFLKEIRKNDLTPVIVLSSRKEEKDKVLALDMGANDYIINNGYHTHKVLSIDDAITLSAQFSSKIFIDEISMVRIDIFDNIMN